MTDKTGQQPVSQKARPMALFMTAAGGFGELGTIGSIAGVLGNTLNAASLVLPVGMGWGYLFWLRPEEIIYNHPTRASVIQTLGGAWMDDFGEGVTNITLTGHTGWRPSGSSLLGGEAAFLALRHGCFELYHQQRDAAAASGLDPDSVQMIFVDTLNDTCYVVYPFSMTPRKHKSRPLLFQYQLRLIGLQRLI